MVNKNKRKKTAIIGLGEIGSRLLEELFKKHNKFEIIAIDKDKSKFNKNLPVIYTTNLKIPADIFIITVYDSGDVLNIIKKIDYSNTPLILIESTINPKICPQIEEYIITSNNSYLAYFPHRYNKGDKKHQIFNQKRVLGAVDEDSKSAALAFLYNFMKPEDIIITTSKVAVYSKIVENSHRFVDIALAEEIALYCWKNNIDFQELRRCVNSKWNIDMKEARKGIYGKCLLKDTTIFSSLFKDNLILKNAIKLDKKYKLKFKKRMH